MISQTIPILKPKMFPVFECLVFGSSHNLSLCLNEILFISGNDAPRYFKLAEQTVRAETSNELRPRSDASTSGFNSTNII